MGLHNTDKPTLQEINSLRMQMSLSTRTIARSVLVEDILTQVGERPTYGEAREFLKREILYLVSECGFDTEALLYVAALCSVLAQLNDSY